MMSQDPVVPAEHPVPGFLSHGFRQCGGALDVGEHERLLDAPPGRRIGRRALDLGQQTRRSLLVALRAQLFEGRSGGLKLASRRMAIAHPLERGSEADTRVCRLVRRADLEQTGDPGAQRARPSLVVTSRGTDGALRAPGRGDVRIRLERLGDARELDGRVLGPIDVPGRQAHIDRRVEETSAHRPVVARCEEGSLDLPNREARLALRQPQQRKAGIGWIAVLVRDRERLLCAAEIADPEPDLADLGPPPTDLQGVDVLGTPQPGLGLGLAHDPRTRRIPARWM